MLASPWADTDDDVLGFALAAPPRARRTLRLPTPEVYDVRTDDGVEVRLTRYGGGHKGPVLVVPGYGTSIVAYTIDTVETNFPEYLFANDYDVWLFDYRASPHLTSSTTQFSIDDIARYDYPAAVRKVREVTGAETIQVMAHCVGAMSFLMAMLIGLTGVRSAVVSQLGAFPVAPTLNGIKAGLHLPSFLTVLGVDTLSTDLDLSGNWKDRLGDRVLRLYPTKERCENPVCRRILFMYGEVFKHEQLNAATHDALHEMFGVANLTTFKHLATMVREGHIVDRDGRDVYMPHLDRLAIPLAIVHGAENGLFLPEGTERLYQLLCERNGEALYTRHVIPDYAHMDCFIGKDAARDVYPLVLAELEKANGA